MSQITDRRRRHSLSALLALTIALAAPLAAVACSGAESGAPAIAPAAVEAGRPPAPAAPALRLDGSVVPLEYQLDLTLDPARPDFHGAVTIAVDVRRPTQIVWMHGKQLAVASATVRAGDEAGREVAARPVLRGEFLGLTLPGPLAPGKATIRIDYTGQLPTRDQEGLFRQTEAGRTYLYSQFEATGARRAFPCFDEPTFKVPWQLTLHVPDGMVALSNTPVEKESPGQAGARTRTVVFRKTRPLPSYLVALAVGPFDLVDIGTAGRKRTPMRIAVPRGRAAETRYARKATGEIIDGLERYFDMPYPYEKLDSVVIPSFIGAMENPGLITYAASIILARPHEETTQFQKHYASIAAHEIGHHWFGDLVTMNWWDDIWLNESFATFIADRVVDDWQKGWRIALERITSAERAFAGDSLIAARKVHNPILEHGDIEGSFDEISYQKGGALLDMFEGWMGRDRFRQAIRRYIAAHAWGNAASRDFIAALAAESKPEIAAAFESFLEQGGIPLVSVALECEANGPPALALRQERFLPIGSRGSAAQTWTVPMCVGFPRAGKRATQCFLFSGPSARVPLESETCPSWVDGNAGGRGYYRVAYAGDLGEKLLARGGLDSAGRMSALFNLRAMVEAGRTSIGAVLEQVPAAARDRDPEIVGVAIKLATSIDPFLTDELLPGYRRFVARSFARPARAIGWKPARGESTQASDLRPDLLRLAGLQGEDPAIIAEARAVARRYLADPQALDPGVASVALAIAARAGDAALSSRMEALFERTDDHRLRGALLAGMVMSRDAAQRERTLARLTTGTLTLEETGTVALNAIGDPATRDEAWRYMVAHLHQIAATLPAFVRPNMVGIAGVFCDEEHRKTVDTLFRAELSDVPGGKLRLRQVMEKLDVCIARRARSGGEVAAFLARRRSARRRGSHPRAARRSRQCVTLRPVFKYVGKVPPCRLVGQPLGPPVGCSCGQASSSSTGSGRLSQRGALDLGSPAVRASAAIKRLSARSSRHAGVPRSSSRHTVGRRA